MLNHIILKIKKHSLSELIKYADTNFGIGKLELLITKNWLNPFATAYLNFRSFPIKQAIRFPIFAYGRPRFYCLSGKMIIAGKINTGMIKFNVTLQGAPSNMSIQSEILNYGQIIFKGKGEIGTGNKIATSTNSTIIIGKNFRIADCCNIGCLSNQIEIGDQCTITHRCQILDSNYHFLADFNNRKVAKYSTPIKIGTGCWICNSSTITGGTVLTNYTTVGSNSLVNKNFSNLPEGSIIGGVSAKFIKTGYRKIENYDIEKKINAYFKNSSDNFYPLSEDDTPEKCSYFNRPNN